ncbi:TNT domain-containing protein [Clostridium sp. YIM B02555]|uniref:TNT domain-containing protein n=1 Tax=Clostridium sp. YIM B02555 TaxID=2911968 RepID=UPI001EEE867F|nr:TNT domain-containing protein [Clostridium sp. YIM B02555]
MNFKVDLGKLTGTISGHDHVMSILAEQKAIVKGALNELYQGGWSGAARDKFEAAHKTREEKYTLLETEVKFMKEVLTYVEKVTAVSLKKDCENFVNYIDRCGIGNGVTGPDTGLISFYGDTAQINRNISNCVDEDYKDILKNMNTITDIISNLEFTAFDIGGDISDIEKSISDQTTSLTGFEEAFNKYYNGVNELENKVCGEFSKLSGITDYKTFEKSSVITANGEIDKNNLEKMLKENSGELSDETKQTFIYLCRVLGKDKFNDLIKEIDADEKEKQKQANINKDILNLLKDNIKDGLRLDILGQAEDSIKNLKSLYGDIGADEYLKSKLGEENYNNLVSGINSAEDFIDDPLKDMNKLNDYLENSETGQYLKENNKLLYDKLKMKLVRQEALTVDVINMGKGILSLHDLLKYNNDVNSDFMEIQVEKALGINGMDDEDTYKKALEANQKDMENAMKLSWDTAKGIVPGIINDVKNTLDPKNAWDFFTNPDMKLEDAQKWSQSAINTAMTVDGVRAGFGFVKGKISGISKVGSEVGLETSLEEGANASKAGKIKAEIDTNLENIKNEEISSADLELKDINKEIEVDNIKNIDKSEIDINNKEIEVEVEGPVKDEVETTKLGNNVEVGTPVIGNVVDTARETEVPKVDKEVSKDIESENVKDGIDGDRKSTEKLGETIDKDICISLRTKLDDISSKVVGKIDLEGKVQQSDIEKYVSDMKNAYDNSSKVEKGDILVPESAEYLKNPPIALDADGVPYSDPNYKWPFNNGFKGKPMEIVPSVGDEFDRVGNENGRFVSPIKDGVLIPKEKRALPYHFTEENIANEPSYNRYKVKRNFNELKDAINEYNNPKLSVEENEAMREEFMNEFQRNTRVSDTYTHEPGKTYSGDIADAFKDNDGGGIQWELPMSVDSLKQLGMIDYK